MRRSPDFGIGVALVCAWSATSYADSWGYAENQLLERFDQNDRAATWSREVWRMLKADASTAKGQIDDMQAMLERIPAGLQQDPKTTERRAKLARYEGLYAELFEGQAPGELPGDQPLEGDAAAPLEAFQGMLEAAGLGDLQAGDVRAELMARLALDPLKKALREIPGALGDPRGRSAVYALRDVEAKLEATFGEVPRKVEAERLAEWKAQEEKITAFRKAASDVVQRFEQREYLSNYSREQVEELFPQWRAHAEAAAPLLAWCEAFVARWTVEQTDLWRAYGVNDALYVLYGPNTRNVPKPWERAGDDFSVLRAPAEYMQATATDILEDWRKRSDETFSAIEAEPLRARFLNWKAAVEDRLAVVLTAAENCPDHEALQATLADKDRLRARYPEAIEAALQRGGWDGDSPDYAGASIEADRYRVAAFCEEFEKRKVLGVAIRGDWYSVTTLENSTTLTYRKDGKPLYHGLPAMVAFAIDPADELAGHLADRACFVKVLKVRAPKPNDTVDGYADEIHSYYMLTEKLPESATPSPQAAPAPPEAPAASETPEQPAADTTAVEEPAAAAPDEAEAAAPTESPEQEASAPEGEGSGSLLLIVGGVVALLLVLGVGVVVGVGVAMSKKAPPAPPAPPA